jgi:putative membrane protein
MADHSGMGLMGGLGMILIWLVPIALVVWLLSRFASGRQGEDKAASTPLEILGERYARGEIGREEYLSRRADLKGDDGS